ncbi:MAG TPA: SIR2 family protein [Telluria sp.]|jgi:hypothetical protein
MLTTNQLESMRPHLLSGHYNLLLGSGISLDSFDRKGKPLLGAYDLTVELCKLKGVPDTTPLSRVSLLLDADEVEKHITVPYLHCRAGETVGRLTSFVWKSVFTLNVDDALEAAYETAHHAKQTIESLNFDTLYKSPSTKNELTIVHLHGFTRQPEKGYVFSTTEYGRVTRGMNAWMHVLSELIASEPFIIAGTTLNEPDLDYYLSSRTSASGRNRGPSLFIEPYPNKITENLCARHGLLLIRAKLSEFLAWLLAQVGIPPTVAQLTVPSLQGLFKKPPLPQAQISFFSTFELVRPSTRNPDGEISPFYYGRSARWSDFEADLDVPTESELKSVAKARNFISDGSPSVKILCTISDPGRGKTTQIRRVAYDLAKDGQIVFCLNSKETIDAENVVEILMQVARPVVLVIDGVADHAASLRQIVGSMRPSKPILILCGDRDYRKDHIDRILGDFGIEWSEVDDWTIGAYEQLIEKLRKGGLLGDHDAVHNPKKFADRLLGDPAAIATCRALNNFKPLEIILRSIWKDATDPAKRSFAIAALGEHCYQGGIFYPILETAYPNPKLSDQLTLNCPLPLAYAEDGDYVLALNAVVADRILHMLVREKQAYLLEIFCDLAKSLSPYVNRRTSISRSPEARLAARLFNSEKVARPMLGDLAEKFYIATRESWQWNSRYWEQRAIFTQASNIDLAVQYARHAVAIEDHPFPWTTLASLLTKKLENVAVGHQFIFEEVSNLLTKVFRYEAERQWRPTPHPYVVLFHAVELFLGNGGQLAPRKQDFILEKFRYCEKAFPRDFKLIQSGERILTLFRSSNG